MEKNISEAYDYILAVVKKQERWISSRDMFLGYKSLFPGKLDQRGFETLYNEMKKA